MVAEKRFRKLNAPHLLPGVAEGTVYVNGVLKEISDKENAA
jgi:hypothetical protein